MAFNLSLENQQRKRVHEMKKKDLYKEMVRRGSPELHEQEEARLKKLTVDGMNQPLKMRETSHQFDRAGQSAFTPSKDEEQRRKRVHEAKKKDMEKEMVRRGLPELHEQEAARLKRLTGNGMNQPWKPSLDSISFDGPPSWASDRGYAKDNDHRYASGRNSTVTPVEVFRKAHTAPIPVSYHGEEKDCSPAQTLTGLRVRDTLKNTTKQFLGSATSLFRGKR